MFKNIVALQVKPGNGNGLRPSLEVDLASWFVKLSERPTILQGSLTGNTDNGMVLQLSNPLEKLDTAKGSVCLHRHLESLGERGR